jgi:ABC-type lipoprotein release transport system permease subunit
MLSLFWTRLTNPTPTTTPRQARLAGLLGMVLGLVLLVLTATLYELLMQRFGPPEDVTVTRQNRPSHFMFPGLIAMALIATSAYRLIFGRPEKPPSSLANVLVVLVVLLGSLVLFIFTAIFSSTWVEALLI